MYSYSVDVHLLLSVPGLYLRTRENEKVKAKENLKNDTVDKNDNFNIVNDINLKYINEYYITKDLHNKVVED